MMDRPHTAALLFLVFCTACTAFADLDARGPAQEPPTDTGLELDVEDVSTPEPIPEPDVVEETADVVDADAAPCEPSPMVLHPVIGSVMLPDETTQTNPSVAAFDTASQDRIFVGWIEDGVGRDAYRGSIMDHSGNIIVEHSLLHPTAITEQHAVSDGEEVSLGWIIQSEGVLVWARIDQEGQITGGPLEIVESRAGDVKGLSIASEPLLPRVIAVWTVGTRNDHHVRATTITSDGQRGELMDVSLAVRAETRPTLAVQNGLALVAWRHEFDIRWRVIEIASQRFISEIQTRPMTATGDLEERPTAFALASGGFVIVAIDRVDESEGAHHLFKVFTIDREGTLVSEASINTTDRLLSNPHTVGFGELVGALWLTGNAGGGDLIFASFLSDLSDFHVSPVSLLEGKEYAERPFSLAPFGEKRLLMSISHRVEPLRPLRVRVSVLDERGMTPCLDEQ